MLPPGRTQSALPRTAIHSRRAPPAASPGPRRPRVAAAGRRDPSPNAARSSLCTLIPALRLFLRPPICLLQTVGGRRETREWWWDPRCHPATPLRPARHPRLLPPREPQTQRRGPRSREPPNSALRTHPIQAVAAAPGPAGCTAPPAASPGKRGRRAGFLLGFLRRGPSSSPAAGVSGRRDSAAGLAGRGRRQHHHVAARRRPRSTRIPREREGRC